MESPFNDDGYLRGLFESYLKKSGVGDIAGLVHENNAEIFFKEIVKDYLLYWLDPDYFSELLEDLWVILRDNPSTTHSKLTDICLSGAELEWHLRNDITTASVLLTEVLDYYYQIGGVKPKQPENSRYPETEEP